MLYGNRYQFRLYDELLIKEKQMHIEDMVLEAAKALYPHIKPEHRVLIICGKGNNGADGLALASLLKTNVSVFLLENTDEGSYSYQYYYHQVENLNIPIYTYDFMLDVLLNECDCVVDGIFGTGFSGELSLRLDTIVSKINASNLKIISIDVPSGLDCDLGTVTNNAIQATCTISFMASKVGYLNPSSKQYTGKVIVEDILYDEQVASEVQFFKMLEEDYLKSLLKSRDYHGYKGTYGALSCSVGSTTYPGAALLSIGAALNTGCGFVKFNGNDDLKSLLIPKYPEVVYGKDFKLVDAYLFGCGKGWNPTTTNELAELIQNASQPILIDADGINCLSEHLDLLEIKKAPIILTPHVGEIKRLMNGDPLMSAIKFAKKYQVIVVLKGAYTIVTDGKQSYMLAYGHKAMAVAGMGDCLAGIISSLLAQHYAPISAALLGVYIHSLCGTKLSKNHYSVLPSRLIETISEVMNEIENS